MLPLKVKHFSHSCKLYFKGSKDREYECMFKKVKGGCLGKSRKEKRQFECDDCEVGVCEECVQTKVNDHTACCASHPDHQLVLKFYDGEGEWECGAAGDDCEGPKDEDEKSAQVAYNCYLCEFDCCQKCLTAQKKQEVKPVKKISK